MKLDKKLHELRHSAAHLLAHAVSELFPDTKMTIGPATEEGFFYDFLPTRTFKKTDLPAIEKRMHEISERDLPIAHKQVPKAEAREIYKDNPFKLELIDMIPGDTVGLATQGNFIDLCKGGHVPSTADIKHFKLLRTAGSYWRADRDNQPLQRISGTAFESAKALRIWEKRREEAIKYDHRRVGKQLDLFSFHDEGPGFPFFHAKGKKILNIMTSYLRDLLDKAGYQEVATPEMLSSELWKQSGHYQHYKNNMYFCNIEHKEFAIKPMNCPGAILLYKERPRSFRELPLRIAEFGKVHRYELSGVLHGLFRARSFTIDDGHIFCTLDQVEQEVLATIQMIMKVLNKFGFEKTKIYLATRPKDAMGDQALWDKAIKSLANALDAAGLKYEISEGEGAFYGPKIEFHFEDSMGRTWQCSTVQLDFSQPENFNLEYVASGGERKRPVMIHRAIYGSFERFFAILLEHFKGALPFWIAPLQVRALTITDDQKAYAQEIVTALQQIGIRAELDKSSEQISAKIKHAQLERIPWMLVIGNKEAENKKVTLRYRNGKQEFGLSLDDLLEKAKQENA